MNALVNLHTCAHTHTQILLKLKIIASSKNIFILNRGLENIVLYIYKTKYILFYILYI